MLSEPDERLEKDSDQLKDKCMQAVKKDLHGLIDTLEDNEARAVLEFARWLRKAEEPTPEEQRAIARGRREIRRGDWVPWRNVKRTDV